MRVLKFIRGPVIFKLSYDQIYQMKTTNEWYVRFSCRTLNEGQKVVSSLHKEVLKFLNFAKNRKILNFKVHT